MQMLSVPGKNKRVMQGVFYTSFDAIGSWGDKNWEREALSTSSCRLDWACPARMSLSHHDKDINRNTGMNQAYRLLC